MFVNGREESLPEFFSKSVSLNTYLHHKGLDPSAVVVERNGEVVESTRFDEVILSQEDHLEILRFVGGGA
ncbi:MAG: sulfur carrier protein ThiS [Desulfobacterales bacterium]|nr:sulfur carrier protein ThiS [Desulfobacterales bacterium]